MAEVEHMVEVLEAREEAAVTIAEDTFREAEALAGVHARELAEARLRLRQAQPPRAESAAGAYQAASRVAAAAGAHQVASSRVATTAFRAAERAALDVVAIRCWIDRRSVDGVENLDDKGAFMMAAEDAFGGPTLNLELFSKIMRAYHKCLGDLPEAFSSISQIAAKRCGRPRGRRERPLRPDDGMDDARGRWERPLRPDDGMDDARGRWERPLRPDDGMDHEYVPDVWMLLECR
jgi:hypothetical protein